MKKFNYLIIVLLLLTSVLTKGQDELKPPKVPPPFPYFKITPEEEREYLKNINSDLIQKLQGIKKVDEAKYAEFLRNMHWKNMNWPFFVNKMDKEEMEAEKKIIEYEILTESLSIEYKKVSSKEKERIKKELQKNLSQLFDLKEIRKEKEVKRLEEQLKEKIANRKGNKNIIVKRRLEELLGESEYLEWE